MSVTSTGVVCKTPAGTGTVTVALSFKTRALAEYVLLRLKPVKVDSNAAVFPLQSPEALGRTMIALP